MKGRNIGNGATAEVFEYEDNVLSISNILAHEDIMCHGDPNLNNILAFDKDYRFIDWVNAGIGNPLFDIAEYIWLNTLCKDVDFMGVPNQFSMN